MNYSFVEAFDLRAHPIKNARNIIRKEYIAAITYIVENSINEAGLNQSEIEKIISARMSLYRNELFADVSIGSVDDKNGKRCLKFFSRVWRSKFYYMLMCDVALILFDDNLVTLATNMMKENLSTKRKGNIEDFFAILHNEHDIEKKYIHVAELIKQFRKNKNFLSKPEYRIIVTANMSAGKSTLINALIGKPLARTSQEACTGNICYIMNKAYEDENIHLAAKELTLCATEKDLYSYDWNGHVSMASHFSSTLSDIPRLCLIDTPGVDAALNKEHRERSHNALLSNDYDKIIYVVSPTRLGTDAEKKHLQWVAKNLKKEKVIFVLNKLDEYHDFSDSIEESMHDFKEDLLKMGFENPVICPISAYFSYLLKKKMTGQALSEDENDEYTVYSRKFKRSAYDLSHYYDGVQCMPTDSEEITLSKHVGLYGLEKIIYGGIL